MQLIPHNCSSSWNDRHGVSVDAHQEFSLTDFTGPRLQVPCPPHSRLSEGSLGHTCFSPASLEPLPWQVEMGRWMSSEMTLPIPSFYPMSFWRTEMLPLRWRSNSTVQAGFGVALVSLLLKPNSNPLLLSVPPPKDFHLFRVIEISNHTWTDLPLTIDLAAVACTIFSVLMDQDTQVSIKFQALSIKVTFKV